MGEADAAETFAARTGVHKSRRTMRRTASAAATARKRTARFGASLATCAGFALARRAGGLETVARACFATGRLGAAGGLGVTGAGGGETCGGR